MKLSDVCYKITDGSHNPPQVIEHSEYLMLSSKNIFDDCITLTEPRYLSEQDFANENRRTNVTVNDLLITIVGTVGRVAIVPADHPPICLQRSVAVLKLDNEKVDSRFMMYQLQNMKSLFEAEAHGVAQKGIYLKQLERVNIECPPLETQKRIAANLDKATQTIDLCNAILEKLDFLVKARFVEMFGDPVSNPLNLEKVELGSCLESIDNGTSYVCDSNSRTGENPAILKLSAVTYGIYKPEENKSMIDDSLFDERAEVKDTDLLFTRKNTPELVGMCAYVFHTPRKLMMPDIIFRLNTKPSCNKIYLWQLINHNLFRKCIQNISNGSAKSMSNISKERLSRLKIPLPPIELQEQFAAFVAQTDKTKAAVQQVLSKAETLKKALMQEYFG